MRTKAKDPQLVSLIGDFIKNYLPNVKHRDEDTIASYKYSINLYLQYLEQLKGLTLRTVRSSDFNQVNIVAFIGWLKTDRGNVATTINHRLADIRGFCKFLLKKKAISSSDYEEIREINDVTDERVVDFSWLSVDEVRIVLESVEDNRNAVRDHFFLSLMYESGARVHEVLALKVSDLKPTGKGEVDVHFFGKGNKHRITPLSSEIWNQFGEYKPKYHPDASPDDLLFYTLRNGRREEMSSDNVSRILKGCEETAKLKIPSLIHLHSHLFRRTRAMHLYQAGVPLTTVSDWLGHSNIETTRFYAKVTEEMKRNALRKLSENENSVFKNDVAFKYADDEEVLRRLCGLK